MPDQEKKSEEYITFLEELIKDYENEMTSSKATEIIELSKVLSKNSLIKYPAASEPVLPEFTKGTVIKEEIEKQFGEFSQRKEKVLKQEQEEISVHTLRNSIMDIETAISVIEMKKIHLSSVREVYHLSFFKSGIFWTSDNNGNLYHFNMDGKTLNGSFGVPNPLGYHAFNHEGDVIFADVKKNAVFKMNYDMTVVNIINTFDWQPSGICFSHNYGHILLGLKKGKEVKVERYQRNASDMSQYLRKGCYVLKICGQVTYITENINGDICISDCAKYQVVAVTLSGLNRFSYNGHQCQSGFIPYGICTDIMGNILVCNDHRDSLKDNSSIHILDQNGNFLLLLPALDHCPQYPGTLCIDDNHNLLVGCYKSPTVTVYRYMHLFSKENEQMI